MHGTDPSIVNSLTKNSSLLICSCLFTERKQGLTNYSFPPFTLSVKTLLLDRMPVHFLESPSVGNEAVISCLNEGYLFFVSQHQKSMEINTAEEDYHF